MTGPYGSYDLPYDSYDSDDPYTDPYSAPYTDYNRVYWGIDSDYKYGSSREKGNDSYWD